MKYKIGQILYKYDGEKFISCKIMGYVNTTFITADYKDMTYQYVVLVNRNTNLVDKDTKMSDIGVDTDKLSQTEIESYWFDDIKKFTDSLILRFNRMKQAYNL